MEQGCRGKSACAVNDAMVTWSVSKGVQGPHGQDYRHGAGVNTLSVYTSGWLDVFTGISTQANDGETAHSEEAWWVVSSLVQSMPVVLILSLVAKASLQVPPQSWSRKFIVNTHVTEQGGTPPESWVTA